MNDLETRKALAQKYLDEWSIPDEYVSEHGSQWLWLGIASPNSESPLDAAAVVADWQNTVNRFLAESVDRDYPRWPMLAVDLRTDTKYQPLTRVAVTLTKANYS